MTPGEVHIGTSGWHYRHWWGPFYPPGMPSGELFAFYTRYFRTVEINNSFYQLPSAETFQAWHDAAPPGFLFAVKANRFITHMKKLKDPQEPVATFMERAATLGEHLGPVLFQLPPKWRLNVERLEEFLATLPHGPRYAFEFRDSSWFDPRTSAALAKRGAAFCIYHISGRMSPLTVTADFVYVRLHGPGGAYQGEYGPQGLAEWIAACRTWQAQGLDVYVYYDNDQAGYAVRDALALQAALTEEAA